jgi:dethiobiotin synthetase
MKYSGCFIAGTDTGVGKTVVTAALAVCLRQRPLNVGVMKPIETGIPGNGAGSDAERLLAGAAAKDPLELVTPFRFPAPLAPLAAARQAGSTIALDRILAAYRTLAAKHAFMLVEGIGGVLVPITEGSDVRDLISQMELPVLVVGRASIGGVNHALLTIEALRQRHIPVLGVVLNRPCGTAGSEEQSEQEASTVALVKERSGVFVAGPLHYDATLDRGGTAALSRLADDPAIRTLAGLLAPA